MVNRSTFLEMMRWGYVNVPGVIFEYSKELDINTDDIGILTAIIYAYQQSKPLYHTGVEVGKILQVCPCLSKQKLSRRLSRFQKLEIIAVSPPGRGVADKTVHIDPLMDKLESFIIRDHPHFSGQNDEAVPAQVKVVLREYQEQIEQLQLQLQERQTQEVSHVMLPDNSDFKKVADFIAKKTGNLISPTMIAELRRWLEEMALKPEFLLCMLELCFERKINQPREISRIAGDLKKYAISNLDGMEVYFARYVDGTKGAIQRNSAFDPDVLEFGTFTGIDMEAEARRRVYQKWRYDWGFSHAMIMKAGEVMCQRTKSGGLEYVDSVLANWMSKEIRQLDQVDAEMRKFKMLKRKGRSGKEGGAGSQGQVDKKEYEIYIPPNTEEIKTKV
ncbi:MAG: DnaD domain protein [Syntrophomonadaceae bacterium]|jgi:DNA replication protein DnaD